MSELVFEKRDFNTEQILALKASRLDNNPIVYILYNEKKKPTAYIGQTVQAATIEKSFERQEANKFNANHFHWS